MTQKIIDGFAYGIGFGAAFTIINGLMLWLAGLISHGTPVIR
jgi:hypothetical protein